MEYTKENIVGTIFYHKDNYSRYKVIRINSSGFISTMRLHDNNIIDTEWSKIDKVNYWISQGVWKVKLENYEIY